ncbi:MAG: hypothetical protein CFE24_12385 [Flavobacterium sp. BFFFF2]|nr:MAG: hypothetical protein CFE24_12385 [Flavobacterium sp. BFFFF2]
MSNQQFEVADRMYPSVNYGVKGVFFKNPETADSESTLIGLFVMLPKDNNTYHLDVVNVSLDTDPNRLLVVLRDPLFKDLNGQSDHFIGFEIAKKDIINATEDVIPLTNDLVNVTLFHDDLTLAGVIADAFNIYKGNSYQTFDEMVAPKRFGLGLIKP